MAAVAITGLIVVVAGGADAAGGSDLGALTPKGCIDDNDTGTDPSQGEDNCASSANGLAGTTSMAISRDGRSVYTVSELEDAVVRFDRNRQTGELTPRGCVDDNDVGSGADTCAQSTNGLAGATALAISADGKSLYAISEQDDAVVRFKRNRQSGKLTPKGCIDDNDFPTDANQGPDDCADTTNGLNGGAALVVSADGRSVYATSEEDDALVRFKRNRASGALTPKGCIDDNDTGTDPGQGEDNCASSANGLNQLGAIVITADGKSLYVGSEGDATVARFKRNTGTGKLTSRGCVIDSTNPAGENCAQTAVQLNKPDGMALSPDGRSLYVSASNDNTLVRFSRNRRSGKLTSKGCIDDHDGPLAGCARHTSALAENSGITVSPDGKSVYVTSETDDALVRFARNLTTGALRPRGCIDDNDNGADPTQGEDSCARSTNAMHKPTFVVVSRDGKSVYATAEIDDAVVRFKRKQG